MHGCALKASVCSGGVEAGGEGVLIQQQTGGGRHHRDDGVVVQGAHAVLRGRALHDQRHQRVLVRAHALPVLGAAGARA